LANRSVLVTLSASLTTNLGMNVFVPNSRAVGDSTGRSSFSGQSEAKDLEELVQWCVNKVGNVERVLLVVCCNLRKQKAPHISLLLGLLSWVSACIMSPCSPCPNTDLPCALVIPVISPTLAHILPCFDLPRQTSPTRAGRQGTRVDSIRRQGPVYFD
jgi:hypothetical protein